MPDVGVILPCRGRHAQTLTNARRLQSQAGGVDATWWAVGGPDEAPLLDALRVEGWAIWQQDTGPLTYWEALARATGHIDAPVLCAIANDLLPGHRWLAQGLAAYRARFRAVGGLLGFVGDSHGPGHSCHFLIGRDLLAELGGWPTWYRHNYGDTELCQRAQQLGRYGKALAAVLYHDHPNAGAADDAIYAAGRATWDADAALFHQRRANGWT